MEIVPFAIAFSFIRLGGAKGLNTAKDRPFILCFILHLGEVFRCAFLVLTAPRPEVLDIDIWMISCKDRAHTLRQFKRHHDAL